MSDIWIPRYSIAPLILKCMVNEGPQSRTRKSNGLGISLTPSVSGAVFRVRLYAVVGPLVSPRIVLGKELLVSQFDLYLKFPCRLLRTHRLQPIPQPTK